jgi:hypothetical protein
MRIFKRKYFKDIIYIKMKTNICTMCKARLVPIGNRRKNGKNIKDWDNRTMHKKCFKEKCQMEQFNKKALEYLNQKNKTL